MRKWKNTFEKLVKEHFKDQRKVDRLKRKLHQLMERHTQLDLFVDVTQQKNSYWKRRKLAAQLLSRLERIERARKGKLAPETKSKLQKLRKHIPNTSLKSRIKLMELVSCKPNFEGYSKSSNISIRRWGPKKMQQLMHQVLENEHKLESTNAEIMTFISDIGEMLASLNALKHTKAKANLEPFVERRNRFKAIATRHQNIYVN
ncbi:uncharacterized protein LOC108603641 [Drosophila busckii]|uniref:uncharacterized protein LOC108603641 n=1 Tax=Drosophila busckii TaxID=30019 RepID=UPI00083F4C51|nr:uncharacterized protein LOC108603641 [Drosophila busckii]